MRSFIHPPVYDFITTIILCIFTATLQIFTNFIADYFLFPVAGWEEFLFTEESDILTIKNKQYRDTDTRHT